MMFYLLYFTFSFAVIFVKTVTEISAYVFFIISARMEVPVILYVLIHI